MLTFAAEASLKQTNTLTLYVSTRVFLVFWKKPERLCPSGPAAQLCLDSRWRVNRTNIKEELLHSSPTYTCFICNIAKCKWYYSDSEHCRLACLTWRRLSALDSTQWRWVRLRVVGVLYNLFTMNVFITPLNTWWTSCKEHLQTWMDFLPFSVAELCRRRRSALRLRWDDENVPNTEHSAGSVAEIWRREARRQRQRGVGSRPCVSSQLRDDAAETTNTFIFVFVDVWIEAFPLWEFKFKMLIYNFMVIDNIT